jgi:hypothetical protein
LIYVVAPVLHTLSLTFHSQVDLECTLTDHIFRFHLQTASTIRSQKMGGGAVPRGIGRYISTAQPIVSFTLLAAARGSGDGAARLRAEMRYDVVQCT